MRTVGVLRVVVGLAGLLGVLVAICALGAAGAAADSFSWSSPIILDGTSGPGQHLVGVACPAASQCTAVDGIGREVTFNPSAPGSATRAMVDSGLNYLSGQDGRDFVTGVACPSVSRCAAVDLGGREVTFNPTAPGSPTAITIDPPGGLVGVACPSVSQCTAVDGAGREFTFNPTAPGTAAAVLVDPPVPNFFCDHLGHCQPSVVTGLSCPSVSQCTAVDDAGREVTFNPTAPGNPTPTTVDSHTTSGRQPALGGVSCPSVSQCTAVDDAGREVTFNPTAPGSPTPITVGSQPVRLACPSVSQCTAVDEAGREVTFDPAAPGTPTAVVVDRLPPCGPSCTESNTTDLACPSVSRCTTVDTRGGEVTFDPNAPGSATPATIDGSGFPLTGVACPSLSQCTAFDGGGREVTFAPRAPGNPTPIPIMTCLSGPSGSSCAGSKYGIDAGACPSVSRCTAVNIGGWEVSFDPSAPGHPAPVEMTGDGPSAVACPLLSQCTEIGAEAPSLQGGATFNPLAPGNPIRFTPADHGYGKAIACPSISQCTLVGGDQEVTFNPRVPVHEMVATIDSGHTLAGVACPSVSQCTAVDFDGREVTFNPAAPASPMPTTIDDAANELRSVACPSVLQCTAVDASGRELTFNPIAPGAPAPTSIAGAYSFAGGIDGGAGPAVACPSVTECVAVDYEGNAFVGLAPASAKAPSRTRAPEISGIARQGQTLRARHGAWTNRPIAYSYQWEDCNRKGSACIPIFGAGGPAYTLQRSNAGHTVRVQETATNAGGPSPAASSAHTAVVVALGNVRVGRAVVRGARTSVPIRCRAKTRTICEVSARLSAIETITGGQMIAVSASATNAQKATRKDVMLGAVRATVRSGHRRTVSIPLNAAGNRLLAGHHTLRVKLTVSQAGQVVFGRVITFRTRRPAGKR